MATVASSVFSSAECRATDAFHATAAAVQSWADLEILSDDDGFEAKWQMWCLGELVFSVASHAPLRFDRYASRFGRYDNDFLLVEMYGAGVGFGRVGDACFENRPGRISLIDMSRGFVNVTGRISTCGPLIPHSALGYDPSVHPPVMSVDVHTARGRVLANAIGTLPDRMTGVSEAEAEQLACGIVAVVRSMMLLPNSPEPESVRLARRLTMENHIEARLGDPDLGVYDLCATFGLSRAALYRHFENAGGVAGYIRERRLNAAYRDLVAAQPTRGQIGEVSRRHGFSDPNHFMRLFKRRFAETPGSVAASPHDGRHERTDPVSLLEDWLS